MANQNRTTFTGSVIGITGSSGKSTTKTMLAHILRQTNSVYATTNNQNLTPYITAALCSLPAEAKYAIFEMAMFEVDMVGRSSALARPQFGIITSIGMNHAEFHSDPKVGIVNSKTELFWGMEPNSTAFLPTQDAEFGRLQQRAIESGRIQSIIKCGHERTDDVRLLSLKSHATFSEVEVSVFGEVVDYRVPVPGIHMVNNSLLVAGAIKVLGEPLDLLKTIETYTPPRSSIRRFRAEFVDRVIEVVDDAVISSPQQVQALLQIIGMRKEAKRRVLVFGDMTALGPDAEQLHMELAPLIEAAGVDKLIAVGPHSARLAESVSIPTVIFKNSFVAADNLAPHLNDGDVVFFKASGPTKFKLILKSLYKQAKFTHAPMDWTIG